MDETKEFLMIPQQCIQKIPQSNILKLFTSLDKCPTKKLNNIDYVDYVVLRVPDETTFKETKIIQSKKIKPIRISFE